MHVEQSNKGEATFEMKEDQPCAMDAAWAAEKQKPWRLRSAGLMLVCSCPKCRRVVC